MKPITNRPFGVCHQGPKSGLLSSAEMKVPDLSKPTMNMPENGVENRVFSHVLGQDQEDNRPANNPESGVLKV